MLSYQHGFHAGNVADVHKHLALTLLLTELTRKETPLAYLDTHAGRGLYDLTTPQALKTAEHAAGIGRLWSAAPPAAPLAPYLSVVARFNPDGRLRHYPGSPAIAAALLRPQDRALLCERHPAELAALRAQFRGDRRIAIHARDALEGLRALAPPRENRGLALIDPSYEVKSDYPQVAEALIEARKHWRAGVFALWYPLLAAARHTALLAALERSGQRKVLHAELRLAPHPRGLGLHGSGLLIANPPWPFEAALSAAGEALAPLLGGSHHLEWLVPE